MKPLYRRCGATQKLSARNQIKGRIVDIDKGTTKAHVRIDIGNGVVITFSITNDAVDALGLRKATRLGP